MIAGLRDAGFDGSITLVGAEPQLPYERPHLSKGYLLGTVTPGQLALRPAGQYRGVEMTLGIRAMEVDVDRQSVALEDGRRIDWDVLCLATGSDSRRIPGYESALYLRELPSADGLRELIERRAGLTIVGAGLIGCEVAAVAVQRGCAVRVFERLSEPLEAIVGPAAGRYLARLHADHGVDLHLRASMLPPPAAVTLVAAGSTPRTELAYQAGLHVEDGIVVDQWGRTSAPGVFAAGDVTRFFSPVFETRMRVEHFQTSQRQGYAVGRVMAGATEPYHEVPWFWSDQYELNLQYAGAALPHDRQVVRGDVGHPPFSLFRLRDGRLQTVIGFGDHHTVARARRLIQERVRVSAIQLEDPGFDLRRALP